MAVLVLLLLGAVPMLGGLLLLPPFLEWLPGFPGLHIAAIGFASLALVLLGQHIGFSKASRSRFRKRKAKTLLPDHEHAFGLLLESITDYGIFTLSLRGMVQSWNRGAERIKGYSSEEIIGRHFSRFYTAADRAANRPARGLAIAADVGRFEEEGWRVRKDGTRFWASVIISAVRNPLGELIGYAKVSRDLTERRLAEQRLAQANLFQQAILENSPYSIIASDAAGIIRTFNPAAERMLWYRADEMIGKATTTLILDHQELVVRAVELSQELNICVGTEDVFAHTGRFGVVEEREWTYVRKDGSRFPVNLAVSTLRDAEDSITGYLGIAYDISERKRREEYTTHVASHDFLTGLPNRSLLHDRLAMSIECARRDDTQVAVLMMDLDHFKRVNDSLGHHIGDELLKTVAERIKRCIRAVDTVARMGGDEFVIVLGSIADVADAAHVAAKIIESVAMPVQIGSHDLIVTTSIGISCYPQDGNDETLLLKNADSAMYRAKADGRNGYRAFNIQMSTAVRQSLEMESAIHRALRRDEFQLHYQPQICLDSGKVIGMEALLRWNDPVLGEITPDQFIPVAEDSGLIVPLGDWVIRTACRHAKLIQQRTGLPLKLAVNLSARQFHLSTLPALIRSALSDSGLSAETLELEITEGALMADTKESINRLSEIRSIGATIAIDDFGIGFSSLSYITRFPVDTLKIDKAFVAKLPHSLADAAVAQAIIALATGLGINVVAEGVETREQLEFLRARSCDAGQGAYLGTAVPLHNFSVQGWCFSKAISVDAFLLNFDALQKLGTRSIREVTP